MSEVLCRFDGMVRVEQVAPGGMVALKGDLSDPALATALAGALGTAMPGTRRLSRGDGGAALWMAADELLLLVPDPARALAALSGPLGDRFVTLADVSDMRAMFKIRGAHSRDVLAKLCPVDFSDFPPDTIRRTRAAQATVALWRDDRADASDVWHLVCLRSVADYVAGLLQTAARPGGEIGLYRAPAG